VSLTLLTEGLTDTHYGNRAKVSLHRPRRLATGQAVGIALGILILVVLLVAVLLYLRRRQSISQRDKPLPSGDTGSHSP
jgi:LPXTG-motif cell wall-anchored protein